MNDTAKKPCTLCWTLRFFLISVSLIVGLYVGREMMSVQPVASDIQLQAGTALPAGLKVLPDVELYKHTGEKGTTDMLKGSWRLAYVGFTSCPDVCPTTLGIAKQIHKVLGEDAKKELIVTFISIDPEYDTPEQLNGYLGYFDPAFEGFTSDNDNLDKLTLAMGAVYAKVPLTDDAYTMDHSTSLYLISPEGEVRAVFSNPTNAQQIAEDYLALRGDR